MIFKFSHFSKAWIEDEVSLVHPYRSIDFRLLRFVDRFMIPWSVILLHWPILRTWSCWRSRQTRPNPPSVIWQAERERQASPAIPLAICAMEESDTRSQNERSNEDRFEGDALPRNPIPISLTLSQERRFSSCRPGTRERDFNPVSVTLRQKLRLSLSIVGRPSAINFKDSSVIFWQSWRQSWRSCLAPVLGWLLIPVRWPIPWSEICQHDLRFNRRICFNPQEIRSSPVLVILVHPPRSKLSRFLQWVAIRPRLLSVTSLHRLRFKVFRFGRSLLSPVSRAESVRL